MPDIDLKDFKTNAIRKALVTELWNKLNDAMVYQSEILRAVEKTGDENVYQNYIDRMTIALQWALRMNTELRDYPLQQNSEK